MGISLNHCGIQESVLSSLPLTSIDDEKVKCPGEHEGFYVCLSTKSKIADEDLKNTIGKALLKLADIINTDDFADEVKSFYVEGDKIVTDLRATNYIADIYGFCDASSSVLGKANLYGHTIRYNECNVTHDENGDPDLASVAGVLLHEISHNIGYDHAEESPSPNSVPYYLGNLIESQLGGSGHSETFKDNLVRPANSEHRLKVPEYRPREKPSRQRSHSES
jgi:hypothetical protein